MNRRLWKTVKALSLLGIVAAVVYGFRFRPVPVAEYVVTRGVVARTVMGTGTLEAKTKVAISPKFTGLLVSVEADQGDRVRAGQKLAEFDANDLQQQVRISEAQLAMARAAVERLNAEIESARANSDYAELHFGRSEELRRSSAIPQAEHDKAVELRRVAAAALNRVNLEKVEAELAIRRHEEEIRLYKSRLADSVLLAPFDGIVVRRNREPGAVVNPGVSILDVSALAPLWASVWVDETEIGRLSVGQEAEVVFRSRPKERRTGVIRRLSVETDRETREYLVEIELADPPREQVLGQRLEAYIASERQDGAVFVPARLLQWNGSRAFVTLNKDGKAVLRDVDLGLMGDERCEALSGLEEGDRVILPENGRLPAPGRRVAARTGR